MEKLKSNSILEQSLQRFESKGEGTDSAALDPTNPKNWDAPGDAFTKFADSPVYPLFIEEHKALENYLITKYCG